MGHIKDLLDENVVLVLSFLRATDLASVREVDKTVFSGNRINAAINSLLKEVYILKIPSPVKKLTRLEPAFKLPDYLFVREVACINFALTTIQPEQPGGIINVQFIFTRSFSFNKVYRGCCCFVRLLDQYNMAIEREEILRVFEQHGFRELAEEVIFKEETTKTKTTTRFGCTAAMACDEC